jgi:hypothetical protein
MEQEQKQQENLDKGCNQCRNRKICNLMKVKKESSTCKTFIQYDSEKTEKKIGVIIDIYEGEKKHDCDNLCGSKADMFIAFRNYEKRINLCLECLYIFRKRLDEEDE